MHHDDALGRLTEGSGALLGKTAAELKAVKFKDTAERMMSLGDLCALVAGRVPLVIEVKSHFDGDRKLVTRMAEVLAAYSGPGGRHVVRSGPGAGAARNDPGRVRAASLPSATMTTTTGRKLTPEQRHGMLHLRHAFRTRPHFVAYLGQRVAGAGALDRPQHVFGLPLLTWTVRTPEQRERAARYADQMIFEGFRAGNLMRAARP